MNKNVTVQEQKSKKKGLFVRSHLFVRLSFIFGIVSILLSVVHVLIAGILAHFGIWPGNLIASIITALAIAGIVLGGIALRDGINVYAILGLILSLIALAFQVWSYYITNVSF